MFHFSIKISGRKMRKLSLGIIVVILTIRLVKCLPLEKQETMKSTSLTVYDESESKQVIHQSNEVTVQQLNDEEESLRRVGFMEIVLPIIVTAIGGVLTQLIIKI